MVKNDLIDRYIYAVTKHMNSAMKKDVGSGIRDDHTRYVGGPM